METTITVLSENMISKSGFIGEHGFSLLIERRDERYLFDTGPGMSLSHNLKELGKSLDGLNRIIISHGHYDHTGGLEWAVKHTGQIEIVAHPAIFSKHMTYDPKNPNEAPRYRGCPYGQQHLEGLGASFHFIDHTKEIAPGLWFITGVERNPDQVPNDFRLVIADGNQLRPDPISDDASLLLEVKGSPVLILGCAHSGVLNILDYVRDQMGIHRLRAILGGTHLMFTDSKLMPRVIQKFEEVSIDLIAVSHCTGFEAMIELANHFGNRFRLASAGSTFMF